MSQPSNIPKLVSHSSTDSDGSMSSNSSNCGEIRCCRCQSTSSDSSRMVCFAINMYYCARCASIVGYGGWSSPALEPCSLFYRRTRLPDIQHFSAHSHHVENRQSLGILALQIRWTRQHKQLNHKAFVSRSWTMHSETPVQGAANGWITARLTLPWQWATTWHHSVSHSWFGKCNISWGILLYHLNTTNQNADNFVS